MCSEDNAITMRLGTTSVRRLKLTGVEIVYVSNMYYYSTSANCENVSNLVNYSLT